VKLQLKKEINFFSNNITIVKIDLRTNRFQSQSSKSEEWVETKGFILETWTKRSRMKATDEENKSRIIEQNVNIWKLLKHITEIHILHNQPRFAKSFRSSQTSESDTGTYLTLDFVNL
jgi:hypothetical protein